MSDPLRVQMSGPLSGFAAGFRTELLGRGYRPETAAKQLQLMAHVSRWLAAHDLEPPCRRRDRGRHRRRPARRLTATPSTCWSSVG
jgi:hypothetical protein